MKKKVIALALGVVMVLGMTACGSKEAAAPAESTADSTAETTASEAVEEESSKEEAAAPSGDAVNLTYWYWADSPSNSECIQKAVENYNATNTMNVTVTAEEYPWDGGSYMETMFTAVMGGGGPDITTFKATSGKLYKANELIADMTDYVDAWEDKGQISDAAWEIMKSATDDGTTSLLPWTLEPLYVYYRPSVFEAAGVEVPTTFDEFMTAVEKCTMDTDGDGKTDVYGWGLRGANGGHEHLGDFLYAYGASWEDLTTPEAEEAYKAYLSIFQNGWAPEDSVNAAYNELVDMFSTGKVAMIMHHIGSSTNWIETFGDDVDAFVFPGTDKGQWTCTGDTEMAVMESCENKDAAWDFYKYMVTGEGGTMWFEETGKSLGTDNVTSTQAYADNRFQAVSAEAQKIAGTLPLNDTTAEFTGTVWTPTNQKALLGEMEPADALAEMQKALWGE